MTRKRFVKLVMAKGYGRNFANQLADEIIHYKNYLALYGAFIVTYTDFLTEIISETWERAWETIKGWFETFENMLEEQVEKE